jgi:spore maturation protein A
MIVIGIIAAFLNGSVDEINNVVLTSTQEAVVFSIGLTGIMSVWLGLMKVAEKSGLIKDMAIIMNPLIRKIFPDIPKNHPAISAIVMNMVANMFGAGNSATALGLKAMKELDSLNKQKRVASNAMIMFLVINMSSIQLIPLTVLKMRADALSHNPTEIIITCIIATAISTISGIFACKFLERVM